MHFLYIKIPVAKHVPNHSHEMEDKVDQLLTESGLGSVAGWGDSLGVALPDGSRPVAYTRIDVDVANLDSARELLRAKLPGLGAPAGTEIHFTIDHRHRKDTYAVPDWLPDQPA